MSKKTTASGVLMHLGKPYAVGLLWFTIQEGNGKNLLQQRLQKTKADYHCLRTHISQQQGFGWLEKGHRRGMPVAAAMVADQLVGEWHGIFEADNGWWYIQVRSDTITPQGDRFFASEEEAFNVFKEEMRNHNWPYAYAPAKWNIADPNVRTLELKSILDSLATTTLIADNVTAIFGGAGKRNAIIGGLVAALVVMGGFAAYSLTKAPEEIVVPPSRVTMRTTKPIPALEPPKEDVMEAVAVPQFLSACGKTLAELYVPIPGWTATKFMCANETASLSWQQESGTLAQARESGKQQWPQNTAITYANRLMTASKNLGQLPKLEQSDLWQQEAALLFLEEKVQPFGAVQVQPVTPKPPPAPVRRVGTAALMPPVPQVQPLPFLQVNVTTGFSPDAMEALSQAKGLVISQIAWDIAKGQWTYEFNLMHARAKLVEPVKAVTEGNKKP